MFKANSNNKGGQIFRTLTVATSNTVDAKINLFRHLFCIYCFHEKIVKYLCLGFKETFYIIVCLVHCSTGSYWVLQGQHWCSSQRKINIFGEIYWTCVKVIGQTTKPLSMCFQNGNCPGMGISVSTTFCIYTFDLPWIAKQGQILHSNATRLWPCSKV